MQTRRHHRVPSRYIRFQEVDMKIPLHKKGPPPGDPLLHNSKL